MDFFIVTPSFNQRRFLSQTIDSVLNQRGDFQTTYWVFDGGSTDGSQKLLAEYGKRAQWQSKKDRGQTHAINKGIGQLKKWLKATKKDPHEVIFAYLNSDDFYLPGTFQLVQHIFKQHSDNWLVGDCVIVDEEGQKIQPWARSYKKMWRLRLSPTVLGVLNPIPQPGVFIRASEILKIGSFNERLKYVMDYDYWFRLLAQSGRPVMVNKALAAFRIHSLSKGGSQFVRQFAEQLIVARKYVHQPALLQLQKLHNLLVTAAYALTKKKI